MSPEICLSLVYMPLIIQVAEAKEGVTVLNIFLVYGEVSFFPRQACLFNPPT